MSSSDRRYTSSSSSRARDVRGASTSSGEVPGTPDLLPPGSSENQTPGSSVNPVDRLSPREASPPSNQQGSSDLFRRMAMTHPQEHADMVQATIGTIDRLFPTTSRPIGLSGPESLSVTHPEVYETMVRQMTSMVSTLDMSTPTPLADLRQQLGYPPAHQSRAQSPVSPRPAIGISSSSSFATRTQERSRVIPQTSPSSDQRSYQSSSASSIDARRFQNPYPSSSDTRSVQSPLPFTTSSSASRALPRAAKDEANRRILDLSKSQEPEAGSSSPPVASSRPARSKTPAAGFIPRTPASERTTPALESHQPYQYEQPFPTPSSSSVPRHPFSSSASQSSPRPFTSTSISTEQTSYPGLSFGATRVQSALPSSLDATRPLSPPAASSSAPLGPYQRPHTPAEVISSDPGERDNIKFDQMLYSFNGNFTDPLSRHYRSFASETQNPSREIPPASSSSWDAGTSVPASTYWEPAHQSPPASRSRTDKGKHRAVDPPISSPLTKLPEHQASASDSETDHSEPESQPAEQSARTFLLSPGTTSYEVNPRTKGIMVGQKEVSQRSFATKGPGKFKGDIERDSGQQLDKSGIARLVTRQGSKTKTKGWTRKGPEMASLTGKEVRMAQMARTERVRLGSPTLESTDEYSQRPEESDAAFAGRINTERQKKGRTRIELVGKNIADARRKGANPGGGRYKNLMPNAKSKEE